jgi:hypothetical protein
MKELMHDYEVLKRFLANGEVGSEGDCAESGT